MKRKLALLLVVTMLLCLVGCEQKKNYNPNLPESIVNGLLAMDKTLDDYLNYDINATELAGKMIDLAERIDENRWFDDDTISIDATIDRIAVWNLCSMFKIFFIGFDSPYLYTDSEKNKKIMDNIDEWKQDIADVLYEE